MPTCTLRLGCNTQFVADPKATRAFALKVWLIRQGEQVSHMIWLGDELGLFRAMVGRGPMTSGELADATGLHERWVREWLACMAAAALVDFHAPDRFELTGEGATVLTDESDPLCAIGAFGRRSSPQDLERLAEAFRTGVGVTYDEHGPEAAHATERMLGPWITHALVPTILPSLPDAFAALERGCRVADIGCGGGVALEAMAHRFPNSEFHGWDPSTHAIARARERLAEVENAWADVGRAEDLAQHGTFDFVLALDCLHDMTRPDLAIAAVHDALANDGTWLIKDIRSTGDLAANMKNPVMAMQYAISVEVCMSSALSEPDGLGLGTCGLHPDLMEAMCRDAGFSRFALHDFGEPANLYYEVRP